MSSKDKALETNARILEAAITVFSDAGFNGARVDEIARQAGVNKATLYYHIGDKKALYSAVLHNAVGHTADRIEAAIQSISSTEEKLRAYVRTFAEAVDRNPRMASIMMRELASGGEHFPEEVARDFARIITVVTGILEEGYRKGIFIQATPFIIHMMVAGGIVLYRASGPIRAKLTDVPDDIKQMVLSLSERIAEEIEQLILNAVMKRNER